MLASKNTVSSLIPATKQEGSLLHSPDLFYNKDKHNLSG